MRSTISALPLAMLALSGCGSGGTVTRESFRTTYYAKCVSSARASMTTAARVDGEAAAAKVCGCTADNLTRTASANDLAGMTDARIMTAGRECVTKLYPRAARRMPG